MAGSACASIDKANKATIAGVRMKDEDDELEGLVKAPAKKKASKVIVQKSRHWSSRIDTHRMKVVKKTPKKAKTPAPRKPMKLKVEAWQSAGGESFRNSRKKQTVSDTLAIARISTWRVDAFVMALKAHIEPDIETDEIMTKELVHGGESMTDVFARFQSELDADMAMERMKGTILLERKLQVRFA